MLTMKSLEVAITDGGTSGRMSEMIMSPEIADPRERRRHFKDSVRVFIFPETLRRTGTLVQLVMLIPRRIG